MYYKLGTDGNCCL